MAEKDLTGGRGSIPKGSASADVRARFRLDTQQFDKLAAGVKKIRSDFEYLNTSGLKGVNEKLKVTLKLLQDISAVDTGNLNPGGTGGGGGRSAAGGVADPLKSNPGITNTSSNQIQANQIDARKLTINNFGPGGGSGGGGAGGGMPGVGRGVGIVSQVAQMASYAVGAMDSRIDSMYGKSLTADKLGVYYQQQMGISQAQYQSTIRQPLTGYRIGEDGVNTLLALQAQTGLKADLNVKGFEGLRSLTGYSLSTGDLAQMTATMGSAQVNNRMTMMLGTGIYGPGGKQRSLDEVIRTGAKNAGLLGNPALLEGARQSGSVSRMRLEAMGMGEDVQNLMFDYANSANQFTKKTGGRMGQYDPSNTAHRQIMGIEENFATQAEETIATKGRRDENFYRNHADDLAKMEQNIQTVTETLMKFDEALKGIIGARIGSPLIGKGSLGSKIIGGGLVGIGALLAPKTMGLSLGISAFGASMMRGDGNMPAGNTMVPSGYGGKRASFSQVQSNSNVSGLNSKFKERLFKMMADNPNVGIGEGTRSESVQRQLFLSRYKKVTDGGKGDVEWEGAQWKRVSGAPAAPPGHSMHEIGLAADLVGDLDWVQKNASKYGLKTFASVNGEPWHIQPAELPNSRFQYEKNGSQWGMPAGATRGAVATDPGTGEPIGGSMVGDSYKNAGGNGGVIQTVNPYAGMSIAEQVGASYENSQVFSQSAKMQGSNATVVEQSISGSTTGAQPAGSMDPQALAKMLYKRGFRGKHLINMLAISGRESAWTPTAHNGKPPDDSYGLFQINMLGKLGPDRLKKFRISKNEQLFDPETNVRAAWILSGGKSENLKPWGIKGDALARTENWMPKAQAAAKSAGVDRGDPMPSPSRGSSSSISVGGSTSITIAPTINMNGSNGNEQDARRIAQSITRMVQEELKKQSMRNN